MNQLQNTASCRVCGGTGILESLSVREMMFGTREKFDYFRCADCHCLQLAAIPENMGDYYSRDYYSCRKLEDLSTSLKDRLKRRYLYPHMTRSKLGWNDGIGRMLLNFRSGPPLQHWFEYLEGPVPLDLPILDVGCGSGEDLLGLRNSGFTCLLGVDPYLREPLRYKSGIEVRKCELSALTGSFGLITMHHVFEHLEDPKGTLITAKNLLSKNGQILIRIPLSDSAAFDKYRENWVQLDAPRHVTLQTRKSMEQLAKQVGLKIVRVAYDSSAFQFIGSERYTVDVPIVGDTDFELPEERIAFFKDEAVRLNRLEKGDQAAFVMMVDD